MILLIATCSLTACKPEFVSEEELNAYVADPENGLSKTVNYKGYDAKVTYKPQDLLILQEGGLSMDKNEYERLSEKYSNQYYFILSLSANSKEALYQQNRDQFGELVQTLSFHMGEYVNITTSENDTLYVADYVFPRVYGMGSATSLMFVFSKDKISDEDEWVQFNMKEFGMGLGSQTFRFSKKDIEATPHIKFKILNNK